MSRLINFLGPLDWQIPEQVEAWKLPGDQIPRQVNLLGSQAGGSSSTLRCDDLPGTGSLGRLTSWDPQAGVGHPQVLQYD